MARLTEREIDLMQQSQVSFEEAVNASERSEGKDEAPVKLTREQESWLGHGVGFAGVLRAALDLFVGPITRYLRRRAAVQQLEALDDRMLQDIGLSRSDIASHVAATYKHAAHRPSLWQILRSNSERKQTIRELTALDDRMLQDIGVDRALIGNYVNSHYSWQANALRVTLKNRYAA